MLKLLTKLVYFIYNSIFPVKIVVDYDDNNGGSFSYHYKNVGEVKAFFQGRLADRDPENDDYVAIRILAYRFGKQVRCYWYSAEKDMITNSGKPVNYIWALVAKPLDYSVSQTKKPKKNQ